MRHSEKLLQAVARAIPSGGGFSPRAQAIEILDAVRAAEAEEMKTDRQALVDTIASAAGEIYVSKLTGDTADAILADFHVSLRDDETEPLRKL